MIKKDAVFPVGEVQKTHGIHGELNVRFSTDVSELKLDFLVFEMDNILVPFFIKSLRSKSTSAALVVLDEVNTELDAREMVGKTIYLPNDFLSQVADDEIEPEYFSGFKVFDATGTLIGEIVDVDDSTINVLFVIEKEGDEIYIPMVEEYILNVDHSTKTITMRLPEGLLEL